MTDRGAHPPNLYLGLDAGGTKTYCLVGGANGRLLGFGQAGCGNYELHGVEPAAAENRKAVNEALQTAGIGLGEIAHVGMGIAGADLPEDYTMLEEHIFTPLFGDLPREFRNDSMAALRGGTPKPYGIVIACGTGCVCAGRNQQGEEARAAGLGDEFGDLTSGSIIGRQGLDAVWQSWDGVLPPTRLSDLFVARSGRKDVETLFRDVYYGRLGACELQPMAQLVFDAAFEGDAVACDILVKAGEDLGRIVNAVARKLAMSTEAFDVVMAGSVFKGRSPVMADAMRTIIHRQCPQAATISPIYEPVVGALLLAMEAGEGGPVDDTVYNTLGNELRDMEPRFGVRLWRE